VLRAFALLDHRRDLEAVDVGQVDVEQDEREVALEHAAQRLAAGGRGQHLVIGAVEHRRDREQILRAVVDHQDRVGVTGHRR